ncbi:hypothetical protein GF359_00305 [candidate division WOR-3 bacterium]|uniref:Uncharacterized protein n=1 Tax=candidate division WOR-3 bacterium TaxID=2052148 RepID=A0A9D5K8H4_UNCW3|nr:hypothetical protein [candidate division WOR-3 bacterium]MBD3363634.1 hypothetical protein [candidate division WOR-3 bacterium]
MGINVKKISLFLSVVLIPGFAQPDVKLTRDLNPNPNYVSYREWCSMHPEMGSLEGGPCVFAKTSQGHLSAGEGLIALVVASSLAEDFETQLNQYAQDLTSEGYTVETSTYSTAGTVEELREYLASRRNSGLEGAVLVGEIPVAWFQLNRLERQRGIRS